MRILFSAYSFITYFFNNTYIVDPLSGLIRVFRIRKIPDFVNVYGIDSKESIPPGRL